MSGRPGGRILFTKVERNDLSPHVIGPRGFGSRFASYPPLDPNPKPLTTTVG